MDQVRIAYSIVKISFWYGLSPIAGLLLLLSLIKKWKSGSHLSVGWWIAILASVGVFSLVYWTLGELYMFSSASLTYIFLGTSFQIGLWPAAGLLLLVSFAMKWKSGNHLSVGWWVAILVSVVVLSQAFFTFVLLNIRPPT